MTDVNTVYEVVKEMFVQRGYTIDEEHENTDLVIGGYKLNSLGEKGYENICCFKEIFTKFNIKNFTDCAGFVNGLNLTHGVIIYSDKITPAVKKLIETTDADKGLKCTFEMFHINDVFFNPTKHLLVPVHTRVPDEEAKILKDKYESSKFPTLKSSDPIARFLAFKKGDIIKIIRREGYIAYRVVR